MKFKRKGKKELTKNYSDKSICRKLIINSQVTINKKNDENRVWNNSFLQKQLLSAQKH